MSVGDDITSIVWGKKAYQITQEFGTYNPSTAGMYNYAASVGYPAGTHVGLDVGVPKFTPIFAAEPGTVIQAGFSDSFRPYPVWVKEDDGETAIYGHLWTDDVKVGDRVEAGTQLGISGEQTVKGTMTPDGSGAHIHFELRNEAGKAIDPKSELTGAEGSLSPKSALGNKVVLLAAIGIGAIVLFKVMT